VFREVSKKQMEAERTVNQLGSIWTESSSKFKSEMERLQLQLSQTEKRRVAAEKALKSVRGDTKSMTGENRRLKKELAEFEQALRAEQARTNTINQLKELNTLYLKRLEDLKHENTELKSMVEMSKFRNFCFCLCFVCV
jgi:chromosome segregation ATPase